MPGILRYASGFVPSKGALLNLLHETRTALATDPRDKIFGLLGLVPAEEGWGSLVDYNRTVWEVYRDIGARIIEQSKSLRLLSAIEVTSGELPSCPAVQASRSTLASWVPDWSTTVQANALGLGATYQNPYDAGGSPARFTIPSTPCDVLSAQGVYIDILERVGDDCSWRSDMEPATLGSWMEIVSPCHPIAQV